MPEVQKVILLSSQKKRAKKKKKKKKSEGGGGFTNAMSTLYMYLYHILHISYIDGTSQCHLVNPLGTL